MNLINPNPKKDWRIEQKCFHLIHESNQIGKATIIAINPVSEFVRLYNSSLEYPIFDGMVNIFETESDAMQALQEQLSKGPEKKPRAVNPKARTDWSIGQECFLPHAGFIYKCSIIGVDPAAAQANVKILLSRSLDVDPLADEDDIYADGEPKEAGWNRVVKMDRLFENEDDAKRALIDLAAKA